MHVLIVYIIIHYYSGYASSHLLFWVDLLGPLSIYDMMEFGRPIAEPESALLADGSEARPVPLTKTAYAYNNIVLSAAEIDVW